MPDWQAARRGRTWASCPATRSRAIASSNASCWETSFQFFHFDLAEVDFRLWVMSLKGEMPFGEGVIRVEEIDRRLAIHLDDDVILRRGHLLGEPLIRLMRRRIHDANFVLVFLQFGAPIRIKAASSDWIGVSCVDLGFVAGRETRLELGAEILTAVAAVVDFGFDAENEIDVVTALAEQVRRGAAADDLAILEAPQVNEIAVWTLAVKAGDGTGVVLRGNDLGERTIGIVRQFPARQVLAIEQLHPALRIRLIVGGRRQRQDSRGQNCGRNE